MDINQETLTLVNLSWDKTIDDDTRDSMVSHFVYMEDSAWSSLKGQIAYSNSVKIIIDTIETLRELK